MPNYLQFVGLYLYTLYSTGTDCDAGDVADRNASNRHSADRDVADCDTGGSAWGGIKESQAARAVTDPWMEFNQPLGKGKGRCIVTAWVESKSRTWVYAGKACGAIKQSQGEVYGNMAWGGIKQPQRGVLAAR